MRHLCTYFDRNYALQGIALAQSLARTSPQAVLWTLCLDDDSYELMAALDKPNVLLLHVEDLLERYPALNVAKVDRPAVEFYYVLTPHLLMWVLDSVPEADGATYLDADVFFFRNCEAIFEEAPTAQVLIVPHSSGDAANEQLHGTFNVSIVHFARTPEARRCLEWWGERTRESTQLGDGVWGDQKYLDDFPVLFEGVEELAEPGVISAPWNLWRHAITPSPDGPLVNGRPLAVFHFARLLVLWRRVYVPIRRLWISPAALREIYGRYMAELDSVYDAVKAIRPEYRVGYTRRNRRSVFLALASGRVMMNTGHGRLRRVGPWIPSGFGEWKSRREARAVESVMSAAKAEPE